MTWAPEFLIVGAARAGTTSLHYLLQQHPEIVMSRQKEPNFFAFDEGRLDVDWPMRADVEDDLRRRSVLDLDAYRRQFAGSTGRCRGEASPAYLPSVGAARRIQAARPDAKVIAVLREPVARAYSHHLQHANSAGEPPAEDFGALLEAEQDALAHGLPVPRSLPYVQGGLYHAQVRRYVETLGPERVQVHLYEDLATDLEGVLRSITTFLGVDPSFRFDTGVRHNAGGRPRSRALARLLQAPPIAKRFARASLPRPVVKRLVAARARLQRATSSAAPALDATTTRRIAQRFFVHDEHRLGTLVGRDLHEWWT